MPKVAPEQLEKRKEEIIDACEKIYRTQGFYGVTLKGISEQITVTRPAIYNYFETKEEILLALLVREYERWLELLAEVGERADTLTKEGLADAVAHTLEGRDVLLRIQNMNLYDIEQNSRIEKLTEFKVLYRKAMVMFREILKRYSDKMPENSMEPLYLTFSSFLFGVYSFVFHTEKQLESMELAGVEQSDVTIYDMVYNCLIQILPEK